MISTNERSPLCTRNTRDHHPIYHFIPQTVSQYQYYKLYFSWILLCGLSRQWLAEEQRRVVCPGLRYSLSGRTDRLFHLGLGFYSQHWAKRITRMVCSDAVPGGQRSHMVKTKWITFISNTIIRDVRWTKFLTTFMQVNKTGKFHKIIWCKQKRNF